jgi:hypothetical protein
MVWKKYETRIIISMFGTPIYGITPMEPNRKSQNLNEHLKNGVLSDFAVREWLLSRS